MSPLGRGLGAPILVLQVLQVLLLHSMNEGVGIGRGSPTQVPKLQRTGICLSLVNRSTEPGSHAAGDAGDAETPRSLRMTFSASHYIAADYFS
eukprot:5607995-Prymnesium_polylepis.1